MWRRNKFDFPFFQILYAYLLTSTMNTLSTLNHFDSLGRIWSWIIWILWLLFLGINILQKTYPDAGWVYWNYGDIWQILIPSILLFLGWAYLIFIMNCIQSRKNNTQVSLWKIWWQLGFLWVFILDIFLFTQVFIKYISSNGKCEWSWPAWICSTFFQYISSDLEAGIAIAYIIVLLLYPILFIITGGIIQKFVTAK